MSVQKLISFKSGTIGHGGEFDEMNYKKWIESVGLTLDALQKKPWYVTLGRVPTKLRALKEEAYTPQLVSIGPYHRNNPELRAMEEYKWRYLVHFIRRIVSPPKTIQEKGLDDGESSTTESFMLKPFNMALDKCGKILSGLEIEVRAIYAEHIDLDKHKLLEMLLVDGCFLLELFIDYHWSAGLPDREVLVANLKMYQTLQHDLVLLENQIPFIVVRKLFSLLPNSESQIKLEDLVSGFFGDVQAFKYSLSSTPYSNPNPNPNPNPYFNILQGLFHPCFTSKPLQGKSKEYWGFKRSATQLFKSGIRFKCSNNFSMENISFIDGVLELPKLVISKLSDTVLRNLIAYEQNNIDIHVVTSYVLLMSSLISSPKDARLLTEANIIEKADDIKKSNSLEEEALAFFDGLCKEVVIMNFEHDTVCKAVEEYQSRPWEWYRVTGYWRIQLGDWKESFGDLKHDYFKNRWSFVATLAAIFVILLTGLQTFYTVRAYYPPYH